MAQSEYSPHYLAGILLFNEGDFFEAHEVWEEIWIEATGLERKFYQGLIQAAVGLCHFGNGNTGGALKLYRTARAYMEQCGSSFHGLDIAQFWHQMEEVYRSLHANPEDRTLRPDPERLPTIRLNPEPAAWPNVDDYLPDEESDDA